MTNGRAYFNLGNPDANNWSELQVGKPAYCPSTVAVTFTTSQIGLMPGVSVWLTKEQVLNLIEYLRNLVGVKEEEEEQLYRNVSI